MKKLNKKVLLLLVLVSFFVGINNVKAIECTYKLPFIGINSSKIQVFLVALTEKLLIVL